MGANSEGGGEAWSPNGFSRAVAGGAGEAVEEASAIVADDAVAGIVNVFGFDEFAIDAKLDDAGHGEFEAIDGVEDEAGGVAFVPPTRMRDIECGTNDAEQR